jgi:phosphoribosylformylglycinamidine (FGAM) synthase-like amidotransferase family enzyme
MAAVFRDREARASLSYMAQVWLRLADNYRDANKVIAAPNGAVAAAATTASAQEHVLISPAIESSTEQKMTRNNAAQSGEPTCPKN